MKQRRADAMLCCVLISTATLAAIAQDGAAERSAENKVVMPPRKIQFETIAEAYAMTLPRVDPALLEQKYIAEIRLKPASATKNWSSTFSSKSTLGRLCSYVGGYSLFGPSRSIDSWLSAPAYFEALVANVPIEERPPLDVLNFFLQNSDEPFLSFVSLDQRGTYGDDRTLATDRDERPLDYLSFFALAPTEERAKKLSEGLLTLFDQGVSRFGQQTVLHSRAETETQLREAQQASDLAQETLQEQTKAIEAASTIEAEAVAELVIRQYLLEVDLAGTHARVDAASKILGQSDRNRPARIEQVEGLKIAAEIELAGLVARKKTLASLISAGKARGKIEQDLARARKAYETLSSRVRRYQSMILRRDKDLQALVPFELVDGTVLIRPLRWEAPRNRGRSR